MKKILLLVIMLVISGVTTVQAEENCITPVYIHGVLNRDKAEFYRGVIQLNSYFEQQAKVRGVNICAPKSVYWGDLPSSVVNLKTQEGDKTLQKFYDQAFVSSLFKTLVSLAHKFVFDQFWLTNPTSMEKVSTLFEGSIPDNKPWILFAHSAGSYAAIRYLANNPASAKTNNLLGVVTFGSPVNYTGISIEDINKIFNKDSKRFWYNVSYANDPIASAIFNDRGFHVDQVCELVVPENRFNHRDSALSSHNLYWENGNLFSILNKSQNYLKERCDYSRNFYDSLLSKN